MQKRLTKQQHDQYTRTLSNRLNQTQQQTANLCLQYYLTYKQSTTIPNDKIPLTFKCAFYMAEKSQYSINMKGQKLRGISFSLNTLLKDHQLNDTMCTLKQMTRRIKFIDEDTNIYLSNVVKQISFLIHLYLKFEKTFSQKLQLKEKIYDGGSYCKMFISYTWLLFIVVKNQVLKRSLELLPNTCMIAHIISTVLIISWQHIRPESLTKDKRLHDTSSERQIKRIIKQKILQIFCIKDLTQYSRVAQLFQKYFNQMIQKGLFRMSDDKFDFLSPENININHKKLDKYYQKNLNIQNLDQRIFCKQRTINLTPSKFTPFARQGYISKYHKNTVGNKLSGIQKITKQQHLTCNRILNYQTVQKQIQTKNQPIHDIKLPINIFQSPAMVKIPFIISTPISLGMEMYNYLNEKKKKINSIHINNTRPFDKEAIILIEKLLLLSQKNQNYDKNTHTTKSQMIVALYRIFCQQYLSTNTHEKDTPQLLKAFLTVSIQLVFFVSNMTLTFSQIQSQLNFQPFQMWKAISFFLNSDKSIPQSIKLHFLDLQVDFISYKLWLNYDMVMKLSTFGNRPIKQTLDLFQLNIQKLFKRTVHQIAFQITRLSSMLELDQLLAQKIFDLMKQIVINHSSLIHRRHLDQLIMCSIYAVCKMSNLQMKFNTIMQNYMLANPNLKDIIDDIKFNVYISQHQQPTGIIIFYNTIFIKNDNIKQFIKLNNTPSQPLLQRNKKNALLASPLQAYIPKQINCKSKNFGGNTNNKNKNGMTPLLYAYSQSPMLKNQSSNFNRTLKSKKVLNYTEQEQLCRKKQLQQPITPTTIKSNTPQDTPSTTTTTTINPHPNTSSYQPNTCDFINKKFGKKSTMVTNQQQQQQPQITNNHGPQSTYTNSQLGYPSQQTITKQNTNQTTHINNSHRTLYTDMTLDRKQLNQRQTTTTTQNIEQTKYRNKNYQFGTFK